MVEVFDYLLAQVLNHHAPLKKCYIRNNENSFQLADKWLTRKTKSLKNSRDKFLNNENYKALFKLKQDVLKSETNDFNKFYADFIEAAATDRQKWQLINEIRNQRKTQTDIKCLRNVFGDYITEIIKMANLQTFLIFDFLNLVNTKEQKITGAIERKTTLQNEHSVSVLSQIRSVTTPQVISR